MVYPDGTVDFVCSLSLEECGKLLSERLLGGIPFVGGGLDSIFDEIPAIYTKPDILGLRFIVAGFGGSRGFAFGILPGQTSPATSPEEPATVVDLSSYLKGLLLSFPEFEGVTDELKEYDD